MGYKTEETGQVMSKRIRRGILIGLTGHAGAGKDAFANGLVKNLGYAKVSFASPVLRIAMDLGLTVPHSNRFLRLLGIRQELESLIVKVGYVEAKKIPEVRSLLQNLGERVIRGELGDDVLIKAVMPDVKRMLKAGRNVVISGVRTRAEAKAILEADGMLYMIHRPGVEAVNNSQLEAGEAFEFAMCHINNDDGLDSLESKAIEAHSSLVLAQGDNPGMGAIVNVQQVLAAAEQTAARAIALGTKMVLSVAAPDEDLEGYISRHEVCIIGGEYERDVTVDGELAGEVSFSNGVLRAEAFIAR